MQEVGNKATGRSSTFAKKLAQITTATEEEVYSVANLAADKGV